MSNATVRFLLRAGGIFVLLTLLSLPTALYARGASGYISAAEAATRSGLEFRDMSTESFRACKLVSPDREIVIFTGLRSLVINGVAVDLARPTLWEDDTILIPEETLDLISGKTPVERRPEPVFASAPRAAMRPVSGHYTVVIDPGHGGRDPGAVGRARGVLEKTVALDISKRVASLIEGRGVRVVMTRTSDVFIELADRAAIANRHAPDLFVSIHANADERASIRGAMVLYPDDGPRDGRPGIAGRALAAVRSGAFLPDQAGAGGPVGRAALTAVAHASFESYRMRSIDAAYQIRAALRPVAGLVEHNDGIIEDYRGLRVLRETRAPSVLVEVDYLSNAATERKLATASYRAELAQAVAEGIMRFLENAGNEVTF